ncbi:MAG: autophagy protein Apg9-domain-containing protein [Benniella sp.]|nr:MAG: autophagy protein Apg9-domain-containing protein [Benniella sp.]
MASEMYVDRETPATAPVPVPAQEPATATAYAPAQAPELDPLTAHGNVCGTPAVRHFWIGQLARLIRDVPDFVDMCNFYTYLLQIPDEDIQTVSWAKVVNRIIKICDNNPNTTTAATIHATAIQCLNANDIANRIMRKENSVIAMFNKELLNLSPPLSFLHGRTVLTRILEWSLGFCVLGFVFDERGQVLKRFLKDVRRPELVDGLRRRFQFMGFATILFAPFISVYLMLYFFFRYFEEYHKNPGSIGTRQYTPLAKWKFKEFNELPHLFETRINANLSHSSQDRLPLFSPLTIFDQEFLLGFEITSEKTVFFYLGLFGTIMATEIFDPESLLREVVEHTHYMPNEWRDKLHTDEVRKQFALLFEYKAVLFLVEFMNLVLTPTILCFSLPNCSEKIVDFSREFTVHVDGVGYVCSFAVFDFKRHGNVKSWGLRPSSMMFLGLLICSPISTCIVWSAGFISNEGKMEKSFLNFKQNNPDWEPADPEGSMYLSRLMEADTTTHGHHHHHHHHHRYSHGESAQAPFPWAQSSVFMRPKSNQPKPHTNMHDRKAHHGRSRLSAGYTQNETSDDEDAQGPGISHIFHLSSEVENKIRPTEQRGEYDEADNHGHQGRTSSGAGFKSSLGDSFVSEIGQSSGGQGSGLNTNRGNQGDKGKGHRDADELSDLEDEREVQKKGVFGLLNQIYEMNTATM